MVVCVDRIMILKILSYDTAFPPFICWCNFERKDDTLSCVICLGTHRFGNDITYGHNYIFGPSDSWVIQYYNIFVFSMLPFFPLFM